MTKSQNLILSYTKDRIGMAGSGNELPYHKKQRHNKQQRQRLAYKRKTKDDGEVRAFWLNGKSS